MRYYVALTAAAALLAACGGDKSGNAAAESAAAMATAAPATPPVVTITAKDFSYEAPDTIQSGMTTVRLVNQGPDLHHIQFLQLTEGKTMADLDAAMKAMKPGELLPAWVHDVAGPNTPVPGGESSITLQLDAGNYAVVCFIPGADGVPHIMKGMIKPITVAASATPAAPAPTADVNIVMKDYSWDVTPEITAGKHVLKLENQAEQSHEMVLAQLAPGKTVDDLAKWIAKQAGPPPAKPLGGISGMAKGGVAYMSVDLPPGEYGLLCFLPDAKDGKEHVQHGMLKQFAVK